MGWLEVRLKPGTFPRASQRGTVIPPTTWLHWKHTGSCFIGWGGSKQGDRSAPEADGMDAVSGREKEVGSRRPIVGGKVGCSSLEREREEEE